MTTQDFIAQLRRSPGNALVFVNPDGDTIHSGYHLTEIKAAKFDTVDYGGEKNRWDKIIMQLWVHCHRTGSRVNDCGTQTTCKARDRRATAVTSCRC